MDYDLIVVKTLERVYKNYYYIIRGEYIGVGSCILGYPANGFPEPIERKADYYKIIR